LLDAPTRSGSSRVFVVVGATESNTNEALGRLRLAFEIAFPAALLVCSFVGWLLAGAALRPVERMRRESEAISALDPGRRLAIPDTEDTLSRLARTLNSTFDRLQEAHERERRFVDDASHELRTPLTILKAEVDTALTGAHGPAELQRTLESASEEIEHLVRIAEGLLVLARSNHGRIPIDTVPTPLSELVEQSRQSFAPRALARGVRVEAHAEDLVANLDRTRVRQALDNLVENSLRHTPPGGVISIAATRSAGDAIVVGVEDSGDGFEGDALGHAFQPFNSPHAGHAGAGLGLAIVDAIAHAHGGSAQAENLPGGGARVTLTLHAPSVPTTVPRTADAPSPRVP
jgi:signal transduction histidine kinase